MAKNDKQTLGNRNNKCDSHQNRANEAVYATAHCGYNANKNKLTETISGDMADYGFDSTTYDNEDRLTA